MTTTRTRFAPSPTGYMHIGGMRTALFNWLWARHNGGTFILRIDDTDTQRNVEEALAPILRAFRWLGLHWDEGPEVGGPFGPYFQSQRGELYRAATQRLLEAGQAFRDFDPPEVTRADREAAEKEKRTFLNIRRSLELSAAQVQQYLDEGRPHVVRFLVPREETVVLDDAVRGRVEWDCGLIPDPVILRADGSPLYNFATVIDDHAMQITDVIRAEEHLSNTPVQILLHQALGHPLPRFAHIPYVAAPGSKEKLSKRDQQLEKYRRNPQFQRLFEIADAVFPQIGFGSSQTLNPVMVEFYERAGFLPQGVLNALSRLGWSLDDKTEIMSVDFVVRNFTLERVIKSPAGLDPDKLMSYQLHWMNQLSLEEKVEGCLPYLVKAGLVAERGGQNGEGRFPGAAARETQPAPSSPRGPLASSPCHTWHAVGLERPPDVDEEVRAFVGKLIQALGERLVLFSDILHYREFFVADEELTYDEKAFDKRIRNGAAGELLARFREHLAAVEPFAPGPIETALRQFVQTEGIKIGDIIHALRVATTGKSVGPGLFECLELLGRDRCVLRIERAVRRALGT